MREKSGLWVIHMLEPKAIIRCTEGHVQADSFYSHFQFRNSDGLIEEWTLSAYMVIAPNFEIEPGQVAGPLLERAWRWFRSYLKWEDGNIDIDDKAKDN